MSQDIHETHPTDDEHRAAVQGVREFIRASRKSEPTEPDEIVDESTSDIVDEETAPAPKRAEKKPEPDSKDSEEDDDLLTVAKSLFSPEEIEAFGDKLHVAVRRELSHLEKRAAQEPQTQEPEAAAPEPEPEDEEEEFKPPFDPDEVGDDVLEHFKKLHEESQKSKREAAKLKKEVEQARAAEAERASAVIVKQIDDAFESFDPDTYGKNDDTLTAGQQKARQAVVEKMAALHRIGGTNDMPDVERLMRQAHLMVYDKLPNPKAKKLAETARDRRGQFLGRPNPSPGTAPVNPQDPEDRARAAVKDILKRINF